MKEKKKVIFFFMKRKSHPKEKRKKNLFSLNTVFNLDEQHLFLCLTVAFGVVLTERTTSATPPQHGWLLKTSRMKAFAILGLNAGLMNGTTYVALRLTAETPVTASADHTATEMLRLLRTVLSPRTPGTFANCLTMARESLR